MNLDLTGNRDKVYTKPNSAVVTSICQILYYHIKLQNNVYAVEEMAQKLRALTCCSYKKKWLPVPKLGRLQPPPGTSDQEDLLSSSGLCGHSQ